MSQLVPPQIWAESQRGPSGLNSIFIITQRKEAEPGRVMRSGCDAFHPLTSLTLLPSTRLQDTQTLHARGTGGFPTSTSVPVLSWQNLPHASTDRLQPARGWGSFPGLTPSRGPALLLLLLKSHWLHEHGGLGVFGGMWSLTDITLPLRWETGLSSQVSSSLANKNIFKGWF